MTVPSNTVFGQGQGVVSADDLNSMVRVSNTFADMRNIVGVSGMQIETLGAAAIGDGGQGRFYWQASGSAGTDNNSTVIVPFGAATGWWQRISSSLVEVVSCSATGTNALTLAPLSANDSVSAYGNYTLFAWVQPNLTTGAVTANFNALGVLNVYLPGGTVQAGTGAGNTQLQSGQMMIAAYESGLNSGLGGFVIVSALPNVNAPVASVVEILFTTSGIYTPNSNLIAADVWIMAGHGGGGGVLPATTGSAATAGGGGAGALLTFTIAAATLGTGGLTVTVGAGGAPGSATGGNGNSGGITSFAGFLANPGAGGFGSTNSGGHDFQSGGAGGGGGAGPANAIFINGGIGGYGFSSTSAPGGGISGFGAPAPLWGFIAPGSPTTSGSATPGLSGNTGSLLAGGGGGGACAAGTTGGAIGGTGGAGFVLVKEYRHA